MINMEKSKKLQITFPDESVYNQLETLAASKSLSLSATVRVLIIEETNRQKGKE